MLFLIDDVRWTETSKLAGVTHLLASVGQGKDNGFSRLVQIHALLMLITFFKHLLNKVAFACRPDTPGERTHLVFLSLGLRHLVVVEEDSHVAGMVTRKDLDYAAGFGPWRRNKQVPKAHALSTLATRSSRHLTDTIFAVCNTLTSQFSSPGPIDDSGKASRDTSCRSL